MGVMSNSRPIKITLISLGVVVAMVLLATSVFFVLKTISPVKDKAADSASNVALIKTSALNAENTGDTQKALTYYRQALAAYVAQVDEDGIADMTAKIAQLEKILAQDEIDKQKSIDEAKRRAAEAGAPDPSTDKIE